MSQVPCYYCDVPVYEFACNACGAPVSIFVRSISAPVNAACGRCGSSDLRRLVSSFAVLRPGGGMDSLEGMEGMDENDPKAMAAWARRMQQEMGDDAGPEFEDMVQKLERGESLTAWTVALTAPTMIFRPAATFSAAICDA